MEILIVKIKSKDKVAFTKELLNSFSFLEIEKKQMIIQKERKLSYRGLKN